MKSTVGKDEWVAMFREIGISDETMMAWHRVFEKRHPEGHGSFLAWLGISPDDIAGIRAKSR
jgi:hypothetical protein